MRGRLEPLVIFLEDFPYQLTRQEVQKLDITNCDIKIRLGRASKTALGIYQTRRSHAFPALDFIAI